MDAKYRDWIDEKYSTSTAAYAVCNGATRAMVEAFPELRRARGLYHCLVWGARTHWWCVTADGVVVDPTARQFPSGGLGVYRELTDEEVAELPSGCCMDCGGDVYRGDTFCSPECEAATRAYLEAGAW